MLRKKGTLGIDLKPFAALALLLLLAGPAAAGGGLTGSIGVQTAPPYPAGLLHNLQPTCNVEAGYLPEYMTDGNIRTFLTKCELVWILRDQRLIEKLRTDLLCTQAQMIREREGTIKDNGTLAFWTDQVIERLDYEAKIFSSTQSPDPDYQAYSRKVHNSLIEMIQLLRQGAVKYQSEASRR